VRVRQRLGIEGLAVSIGAHEIALAAVGGKISALREACAAAQAEISAAREHREGSEREARTSDRCHARFHGREGSAGLGGKAGSKLSRGRDAARARSLSPQRRQHPHPPTQPTGGWISTCLPRLPVLVCLRPASMSWTYYSTTTGDNPSGDLRARAAEQQLIAIVSAILVDSSAHPDVAATPWKGEPERGRRCSRRRSVCASMSPVRPTSARRTQSCRRRRYNTPAATCDDSRRARLSRIARSQLAAA
jgi:hypothetical protein